MKKKEQHWLRHCMVVYSGYPHFETRVQREAEALVAHGIDVDVICPTYGTDKSRDEHRGVHIHRVKLRWRRKKNLLAQFLVYLTFFVLASIKLTIRNFQRKYDVIQLHNLPDFLVFAAWIPKLTGSKVILDLHDLMPEFFSGRFGQGNKNFLKWLILLQEHLSCQFADHVITVTEHWRQTLIGRGVPAEKCSVIMNLADTRIFKERKTQDCHRIKDHTFTLFYHGDMPERYGLDLVLKAVHQLRDRIPHIWLKLVGGGQYVETLKRLTEQLELNQVEFIGGVPVEELPALIVTADICVVPYRNDVFTDSLLPTKLMEYAVMGLPVIAAKTHAISAYFDDSMVQFFKPDDLEDLVRNILYLYSDHTRREQLSRGILKFHDQNNWQELSERYVALVKQICNQKESNQG